MSEEMSAAVPSLSGLSEESEVKVELKQLEEVGNEGGGDTFHSDDDPQNWTEFKKQGAFGSSTSVPSDIMTSSTELGNQSNEDPSTSSSVEGSSNSVVESNPNQWQTQEQAEGPAPNVIQLGRPEEIKVEGIEVEEDFTSDNYTESSAVPVEPEQDYHQVSSNETGYTSESVVTKSQPKQAEGEVESLRDKINFKEVVGTFKIFVGNLPLTATNDQLREMFAPYGTVLDCEVFKHKKYAFVHMDASSEGNKAVKDLNGLNFDGSTIRVQRSTSVPELKESHQFQEVGTFKLFISQFNDGITKEEIRQMLERFGRIVDIEIYRSNSAFVHMEEESAAKTVIREINGKSLPGCQNKLAASVSKNPEGPSIPTLTLHVKNFGAHISASLIRSLFQPYGLVLRCTITDQHVDILRKAIVLFEQLGDVRSAINDLNNYELDGQKLSVKAVFDEPTPPLTATPPKNMKLAPLLSTPTSAFGGQRPSPAKKGRGGGSPSFFRGTGRPVKAPLLQQPVMQSGNSYPGGRGGMMASNTGRDNFAPPANRSSFQLIPMPSKAEINQSRSRGQFGGRARGGGRGRGQSRGNHNNQGFDQDSYDFDEYYQDPQAASSREHLSEFQMQQMSMTPPQKKPKVNPVAAFAASHSLQPQPLMGIDFNSDMIEDQPFAQPNSTIQNYDLYSSQQVLPPSVNYFSSEQIAGSSTNHSNFEVSSNASSSAGMASYPANYYEGVEDFNFNAVPFDYNNIKRGRGRGGAAGGGRGGGNQQQSGYSVRGSRGKSNKKGRPRPGLGSKSGGGGGGGNMGTSFGASSNTITNGGPSLSGGNQMPLGGGGVAGPSNPPAPTPAKNLKLFGRGQRKSKEQIKDESNQEYVEWLQQKSWLYTPILGIVKPASK